MKLVEQGRGCFDEDGTPRYILDDGRRCSIGWLVDEETAWALERDQCRAPDVAKLALDGLSVELVFDLMAAHDVVANHVSFAGDLLVELDAVAFAHGL